MSEKKEFVSHVIIEAIRCTDNKRYMIICSDDLLATQIYDRACALIGRDSEIVKIKMNGFHSAMRQVHSNTGELIGITIEKRDTFLYGTCCHDISDEEIALFDNFIKTSFPASLKREVGWV